MRLAWISCLDASVFDGGGERAIRDLLAAGRARGHVIAESPLLRSRPQRALRRIRALRGMPIDWSADVFVLADLRNRPGAPLVPEPLLAELLNTQRTVTFQNAWVDVCQLDVPCGGDRTRCPSKCDRSWSNRLFSRAKLSVFVSPLHHRIVARALDVPLPRSLVMPPYIDTDRFRVLGVTREIDVLYVGTISRAKGYYRLLERFGPDRITLVGHSALGEPVQGNHLGPIAYEELPLLYNRARLFAHLPEWYEPMGRTVVEAALCGCKLVTNERVGAMSFDQGTITDPAVVAGARERFWNDFEQAVAETVFPAR